MRLDNFWERPELGLPAMSDQEAMDSLVSEVNAREKIMFEDMEKEHDRKHALSYGL